MEALNGWDASGEVKTKAIRDTLACIFAKDVALCGESQDEGVSRLVRQQLVDRVAVRAMARKMEVRSLWRNILTTWRSEPGMDEALLPLIVSQFDELLNGGDTVSAGEPGDGKGRKRRTGLSRFEGGRAPDSAAVRVINATAHTRRNHWLDQEDVRKIWDAASFMVQRYGVLFNTRIVINYARLGIHDNVTMTKFHTSLINALRDRFRRYSQTPSGDPQHHWLYVHETVGSGRFRTQFAAHFPPSSDDTIDWLHRRFSRWTGDRFSPGGVNIALLDLGWNRHLKLVRSLCRGIDPNIHVPFADSEGNVYQSPLADILGIRTLIRGPIGGRPGTQRMGMSTSINETEWARSSETLPPLFAFDACDWARIASGWECEEARYRRELVRRRQELEQQLDADYPEKGDSPEGQERVKAYEDHLQRWMAHAAIREGNRPGMEGARGKPARD